MVDNVTSAHSPESSTSTIDGATANAVNKPATAPKPPSAPASWLAKNYPVTQAPKQLEQTDVPELVPCIKSTALHDSLSANDEVPASVAIITVIRDPKHPLGKTFTLNPDGTVSKEATVNLSFGIAVMRQVDTHEEFAALMLEVGNDPHAAIINASFVDIPVGEEFLILSEREIESRLGIPRSDREKQKGVHTILYNGHSYNAVGRFKENVRPSCWQYFDRDIDQHTPEKFRDQTIEEWLADLSKIVPGLAVISYCQVGSTSSRVFLDGKPVGGGNGHLWFKVKDPSDVERFRTAILIAAAKAELTWLKPRYSRKERI